MTWLTGYWGMRMNPRTNETYSRKLGDKLLGWDEGDVIDAELKYRKENWEEHDPDAVECPPDDEILKGIYQDGDILQMNYDDTVGLLTDEIASRNPGGNWSASANAMGWQARDAHKEFHADDGASFLKALLPDCDTTWYVHSYGDDGVALQIYSHDSPTGYWVYCWPTSEEQAMIDDVAGRMVEDQ